MRASFVEPITAILVGAGARGRFVYGAYAQKYSDQLTIVAVADPDEERRKLAAQEHNIPEQWQVDSWEKLLESETKLADIAIICTQDRMHRSPALRALELGYDVLLEKPMSPLADEVVEMTAAAQHHQRLLTVCHVLRYTTFWSTIKQVIASGEIGEIVSIQLSENVGYFHMAHSFVRGNWNRSEVSSPMILQKSCHDMDIISWLMDRRCLKVSSYGSLLYFNEDHAPEGSTDRCTSGCQVERQCPYSAIRIYLENDQKQEWSRFISHDLSEAGIRRALEQGEFGRCVYRCHNNVVDHQVVNFSFEGGATASFTMSGFTHDISRTVQVMGTLGEIRGYMEKNQITHYPFGKAPRDIVVEAGEGGHGGGDEGLVRAFLEEVRQDRREGSRGLTSAEASMQSHLMAFAAERSRVEDGRSVTLEEILHESGRAVMFI